MSYLSTIPPVSHDHGDDSSRKIRSSKNNGFLTLEEDKLFQLHLQLQLHHNHMKAFQLTKPKLTQFVDEIILKSVKGVD